MSKTAGAALLFAGIALLALVGSRWGADEETELVTYYPTQQGQMNIVNGQMLPEYEVSGTMETGEPEPQGIPLSFQLPVPLPAPSPPRPSVITVGPRPKKAPVCKRCEKQMRKIKVCCTGP
jgi:hypothetical protein